MNNDTVKNKRPAFSQILFSAEQQRTTPFHATMFPIILQVMNTLGLNVNNVIKGKSIFQLPLNPKIIGDEVDHLHIDMPIPHIVFLYYCWDSDGDTIIVDKKFNTSQRYFDANMDYRDFKILEKVTPKRGRVVVFDGHYYHTAEQPKIGNRCIVNYNLN
jgi:hypothetical protein